MIPFRFLTHPLVALLAGLGFAGANFAAPVQVKVSVENLAPANSISLAPLRVAFNFAELAAFKGLATAPGYTFLSQLTGDSAVYRISFEIVPVSEPGTYALMALGLGMFG